LRLPGILCSFHAYKGNMVHSGDILRLIRP